MRVYTRTEGGVRFEELTYVNSLRNGVFKVSLFLFCDFPFPAKGPSAQCLRTLSSTSGLRFDFEENFCAWVKKISLCLALSSCGIVEFCNKNFVRTRS
jgi:hypothetical protein